MTPKTIPITGCSSGIGAAVVREFGKRRHRAHVTDGRAESPALLERNGVRGLTREYLRLLQRGLPAALFDSRMTQMFGLDGLRG